MNKTWLCNVPHIRYLDLAIIFFFPLENQDYRKVALVTNSIAEKWNVTAEELEKIAAVNTPKVLPISFMRIETLMKELALLGEEIEIPEEEHQPMYIVTNENRMFGASGILYPGALKQISDWLQDDLYILPSSIHECIVIPCKNSYEKDVYEKMVHDVNEQQVTEEEFLSNTVYVYYADRDSIGL